MKRTAHNLYTVYNTRNLLNSLRLSHGLMWRSTTPGATEALKLLRSLFYIFLIILAYGIVGRLDYEDALVTEAITQESEARRMSANLADCMNGKAFFTYDDPNPLPNGYGKIAVICRKAEEIRV